MNILCPSCHSSIPVSETDPLLRCASCGLTTDLSSIGTYPGGASLPLVRDLSGETIDGFRVDELIGVGGMGVVYRAERLADGARVAIKVLHPSYVWNREEFVARFAREARALARLEHPGIVRILDSGQQGDLYYLVTEFVEGVDLARHLRLERPTVQEIVAIMIRVCEAIGYAHENGVVHRDIKPANIMVDGDSIRVLDFGLAQIAGGDTNLSSLTRTDLAMGTFNYLSPEQRTNAKQVDQRSDVFSLGVVFFELLTGTLPLGNFTPPSRARADAGKLCDRIVDRSLNADPADRYQSVSEMIADLRQVQTRSRGGRRLVVAVAAGLGGVAAALVLALGLGAFDGPTADDQEQLPAAEGKAERGQVPPFVDVGQIQQALDSSGQQLANEPGANDDVAQQAEQQAAAPVKTEPAKTKKKKKKKKPTGKKGFVKGKPNPKGDAFLKGGKGISDDPSPADDQGKAVKPAVPPQVAPSQPAPQPAPQQPANPPATEQTQGKKKSKYKGQQSIPK